MKRNLLHMQHFTIRPLLTIALLCTGWMVNAQKTTLTVSGVELTMTKNATVAIKGNLVVKKAISKVGSETRSKDGEIMNSGNLFVSDSILNYSHLLFYKTSNPYLTNSVTKLTSAGVVTFNGISMQPIICKDNVLFHDMDILNPMGIQLNDTICALGKINPKKGSLFLNGKNLEFFYDVDKFVKYDGRLDAENNNYKVWDNTRLDYPLLNKRSGHIISKYQNYEALNASGLGIGTNLSMANVTSIERGHLSLGYAGNKSIQKYFVLNTNNSSVLFDDYFEMTYLDSSDYANLHVKEPDFCAFLNQGNSPVTYSPATPGSTDITLNKVTGHVTLDKERSYTITIADSICDDPPKATLSVKANVCQGVPFQITTTNVVRTSSQMLYYHWYRNSQLLADTGQVIKDSMETPGNNIYKLKIYDNRGCFSYSNATVTGMPLPKAYFKTNAGAIGYCLGTPTIFTDTSKISDKTGLTSFWSLDDGATSTESTLSHTYETANTFHVKLVTTSSYGCRDSVTHDIAVHPLPEALFSSQTFCGDSSLYANFINSSVAGNVNAAIAQSKWGFGVNDTVLLDTDHEPLQTLTHHFTTSGLKNISLTVNNSYGCKATYVDSVKLSRQNIGFTTADICLGDTASFNNLSTTDEGVPQYTWDFGDKTTSSETNPQKKYTKTGSYEVTLYMQTGDCIDSLTKTIWVNPLPSASFSADNACAGSRVDFTPSDVRLKSYAWSINNTQYSAVIPSLTFPSGGRFPVSLTVTSNSGCTAVSSANIEIYLRPVANFTYQSECLGKAVNFYNQSSLSGGTLTYEWRFDDNKDTSKAINPQYPFSGAAGNKNVELIATSNHGCADTIVKSVEIYPLPSAGMATPISTCGNTYTLDASTTPPGVTIASYVWNNGSRQPLLTVNRNGSYSVDITSTRGCKVTDTVQVTLNTKVDPRLPNDTSFCGQGILDALYPDANCTWSTGDKQRKITVVQNGWYSVSIVDQNNCTAIDSVHVTVNPVPQVSLGTNVNECIGTAVHLDAGAGFSAYNWSNGEKTRIITIISQNNYKVTVTDANGCTNTSSVNVSFLPVPSKPLPNEITECKYATIDAGISASSYLWSTGEVTDIIRVNQSGTYWVKVSNGYQCFTYDTVKVNILPIDNVNLGKDISVCEGQQVILNAGQHGAEYSYLWNRQASSSPVYNVKIGGRYIAELLNNTNGCKARDTINVQFLAGPRINLGNDRSLCNSNSLTLDAGNPGSVTQWGSSNGLVSTQQTIDLTGAGKYWVTVVNENGCIAFDTVQIYPSSADITPQFIFDSEVYAGDTVNFCNVSYPTPYSSNWQFGDGVKSTLENPSHVFYYTGSFNVILKVSNEYCSYVVSEPIIVKPLSLKKRKIGDNTYGKFIEITSSKLYPNPNKGEFTLELKLSDYADIIVSIFDLKGGLISVQKFKNIMEFTNSYSLRGLSSGVYILKATVGNKNSATFKIIKY